MWGIVRPNVPVKAGVNQIICCCFYSPPIANKNLPLLDHLSVTLQKLLAKFPKSGVLISGDGNKMTQKDLLGIDSSLKQIVDKPTRGKNILDIVLTNLHSSYNPIEILPPIQPDSTENGVPSDHNGILICPKFNSFQKNKRLLNL